jgi:formiminoglutamase
LAIQPFANSDIYRNYLKTKKVKVILLEQLRSKNLTKTLKPILSKHKEKAIFWGFDMDSVRSADAPGVSASYPTGLTAEEVIEMASIAGSNERSRVFEISEVNPTFDLDNRTCKLAALLIVKFLKPNG